MVRADYVVVGTGSAGCTVAPLRRILPNVVHSVYRPVGTCQHGTDERAVVDPRLRVLGVEGLRVADASVMPSVTGGDSNAPSIMIGERCAGVVLGTEGRR